MQNIEINDDFRAMLLKLYWECYGNANDSISVILFDGTPPTQAEMQALADTTNNENNITCSPLHTFDNITHKEETILHCTHLMTIYFLRVTASNN